MAIRQNYVNILWRVVDLRGDLYNKYRIFFGGVEEGCLYSLRNCVREGEQGGRVEAFVVVEGGDG